MVTSNPKFPGSRISKFLIITGYLVCTFPDSQISELPDSRRRRRTNSQIPTRPFCQRKYIYIYIYRQEPWTKSQGPRAKDTKNQAKRLRPACKRLRCTDMRVRHFFLIKTARASHVHGACSSGQCDAQTYMPECVQINKNAMAVNYPVPAASAQ